ncbi:hypothetical protein BRADI_1g41691v3, partial [Brachypodium distachyon]
LRALVAGTSFDRASSSSDPPIQAHKITDSPNQLRESLLLRPDPVSRSGLLPAALQISAAAPSPPCCSRLLPSPFDPLPSPPVSLPPPTCSSSVCAAAPLPSARAPPSSPSSYPRRSPHIPPPALRRRPETRPGNGQRRVEQPATTAATLSSGGDALLGTEGGGILLFYLRYGLSTQDAAFKVQSKAL